MLISRTPFRFSLIGGGSDLPAYYENYGPAKIISMTLQASMYVTYSRRNLYSDIGALASPIRLSYSRTENVNRIEDLEHDLVRGVLEVLRDEYTIDAGFSFEMTTIADIPSRGAGLGSSSALIVGILKLFPPALVGNISDGQLAEMAFRIETEKLGKNIGFQDHYSAVFGGLNKYIVHSSSELSDPEVHSIFPGNCSDFARHLMAFRLPYNRSSDTAKLPEHQTLDAMKLALEQPELDNSTVFHIRETVDLVDDMWNALGARDFKEIGRLLDIAWYFKKKSHNVFDPNIDRWYNKGVEAGALAGKVSGSMSGGAGHLFFLAYPDDHERIRTALEELVEMRVDYYPHGSTVTEV